MVLVVFEHFVIGQIANRKEVSAHKQTNTEVQHRKLANCLNTLAHIFPALAPIRTEEVRIEADSDISSPR